MNDSQLLSFYKSMLRIRRVEEVLADRYAEQEMRCPMHLCIGQEAIAVGVCAVLNNSDKVCSNHRAHGHYLAKGGDLDTMVAEIYGKSTNCAGGRGGSMHLIDLQVGFMGATPIVGGTVPLSVGSAWADQLLDNDQVTVVFFGDGCFEEGVMHESLNFAALHQLPVIFVCENNDFSVYTHRNERQPDRPIYKIAEAHGLSAAVMDGNSVLEVFSHAVEAVKRVRSGGGGQFLEMRTYRWREHCGPDYDDHLNYRPAEEIEQGLNDCPVSKFKSELINNGVCDDTMLSKIQEKIDAEIDQAFKYAKNSPKPTVEDASKHIYF